MSPERVTELERYAAEQIERCRALDARRGEGSSRSIVPTLAQGILDLAAQLRAERKQRSIA